MISGRINWCCLGIDIKNEMFQKTKGEKRMKANEFHSFLNEFADMVMDYSHTKLKNTNPEYRLQMEQQCKTSYEVEQFIQEHIAGAAPELKAKIEEYFQRRDDLALIEVREMYFQGYRDCIQLMQMLGLLELK